MEITHQHHSHSRLWALGLTLLLIIFGFAVGQQPQAPVSHPTQATVQHFYAQHQSFSHLFFLNHGHSLD